MAKSKKEFISRGTGKSQDRIQASWFLQHAEDTAIRLMPNVDPDRMRSMWKEANGKSVPNHTEEDTKPKRPRKKKEEE